MEKIIVLHEEGNIILVFPNRKVKSKDLLEVYCFSDGHTLAHAEYLSTLAEVDHETSKRVINNYLGIYETII